MGHLSPSTKTRALGLFICLDAVCLGSAFGASVNAPDITAFYSPYSHQVWRVFIPGRLTPQAQNDAIRDQASRGCGCASLSLTAADVKALGFSRTFAMNAPPARPVTSWGDDPNANLAPPMRFDRVIAEALDPNAPPDPRLIEAPR